jgi:signal recognition particle subunit SRP54
MDEPRTFASETNPKETLPALDSMMGKEELNIAPGFREVISVTGLVLTKMDWDARDRAAISVRGVTGLPIQFLGTGEKLGALEKFHPARPASRILDMGDIIGLIEPAEGAWDSKVAKRQGERLAAGNLSVEDWLEQVRQKKNSGSVAQILETLPGKIGKNAA